LSEDTYCFNSPEELEDYVMSVFDIKPEAGLISDFVLGCWTEVNWQELYDHYKDDE
jgi:hypothetical protein